MFLYKRFYTILALLLSFQITEPTWNWQWFNPFAITSENYTKTIHSENSHALTENFEKTLNKILEPCQRLENGHNAQRFLRINAALFAEFGGMISKKIITSTSCELATALCLDLEQMRQSEEYAPLLKEYDFTIEQYLSQKDDLYIKDYMERNKRALYKVLSIYAICYGVGLAAYQGYKIITEDNQLNAPSKLHRYFKLLLGAGLVAGGIGLCGYTYDRYNLGY